MTSSPWETRIESLESDSFPASISDKWGRSPLRYVGKRSLIGQPAIGVCGSRDATDQSLELAAEFGRRAAELGFGIVSGNARGVDAAAQHGALEGGGWTVAVLAEGLGGWKPRKPDRPLISSDNFAAVTKYEDEARWQVSRAMERNGLIVALSDALIVVQAGTTGGTWNAGLECLRQGKPLLVVEREKQSPETEGNRKLLKKGGIRVGTMRILSNLLCRLQAGDPLEETSPQERLL